MKKILLLIVACIFIYINGQAQVASYTFSQSTMTYTEITTGTVLGSATTDEERFLDPATPLGSTTATTGPGLPIGFNFTYNGNVYDVFAVNANGWICLGQSTLTPNPVNMASTSYVLPISTASTAPAILQGRMSVFGRNIAGQTGSELRYDTIGVAPYRTLVIQWKNFRRNGQTGENFNFQINLYETTNVVEFVYGTVTVNANNATAPQVGLRGSANTDFNNRSSTTNWSATTAGAVNTASVTISLTVYPTPGLIFRWTPPMAVDAGISAINSPAPLVPSGVQDIAVTVKNFGTDTLHNASIGWSVNGAVQTPHLWADTVAQGGTNGPDTIGTYNFTTAGSYTIKAWTTNPNGISDQNSINDTISKVIYVQGYAAIPFYEGFDSTWINKLSTYDVPSAFWANTPVTGNNSWRRDDQGATAAWTSTTGGYTPAGSNNTIHSARFHSYDATANQTGTMDAYLDFTPAGTKMLKFWYFNPTGTDSLALYLSTDAGVTFNYLQKFTSSASWVQNTVTLSSSTSATSVIRFKSTSDYGNDDIGIDGVQVYLQPSNDMAAVEWVTPVGGCGLTSMQAVTVKVTNAGTVAQSNIPIGYTINGGITIIGPEFIPGPVNPGDTISYTFTATSNFSVPGVYNCGFAVVNPGDQLPSNDSAFATITAIGTINTFPFIENFNNPSGSGYFLVAAAANASADLIDTAGVGNTGCAFFTGFMNNTGWAGTGTIPAAAAYGTYTTHHSTLTPCNVDATALTSLRLSFDLMQKYYTQRTYTWMAVIANGTDTLTDMNGVKYFNPTTGNADPYVTRTFDLTAYAGTSFNLHFKSACKYNSAAGAPGNNNYIDNIIFFVPSANDVGVAAVLKPISQTCGVASDSVFVTVSNMGSSAQTNIPVIVDIAGPSGNTNLNGTLAGPLAPNTTDTLYVGLVNTLTPGTYSVTAYTNLSTDAIHLNDTTTASFTISLPLSIPHLEDFEGALPLANWTTNFITGAGHGNTSTVMYRSLSNTNTTGSAAMNMKIGPVTNNSYLTFDYRVVSNTGNAVTLRTDTFTFYLSSDCGVTQDIIYLIDSLNHTTSNAMKHVVIPISSYAGTDVIPSVFANRGNTVTYYLDIDNVGISEPPVVDLGPDDSFCGSSDITLDAGYPPVGYDYIYNWSTLAHPGTIATDEIITVDSAATYIVNVDNGYGLVATDTIIITINPSPVVSLGLDTTICGSFMLDAGTGNTSYAWSTGATTQTIVVTQTDDYWVDVTNSYGCTASDTILVTIIPIPVADAGPAQSICYLDVLHIVSATATDYSTLLWTTSGDGTFSDATLPNPDYTPGTSDIAAGSVNLTLTVYADCDTVSSQVAVTITTVATAFAGSDVTICAGESTQLSATGGSTYAWSPSTGLSNAGIANPLASPLATTTYVVTVTSSCGSATDNVVITVDNITATNLGADASICEDQVINLDAGSGYDSYLWSTGATTQAISVPASVIGIFQYTVTVTHGVCSSSDMVSITVIDCSGIIESGDQVSVNIFPNPTDGKINVVIQGFDADANLSIFNIHGQLAYNEKISGKSKTEIDLSYLPAGVYLIKIYNEKQSVIQRLIVE